MALVGSTLHISKLTHVGVVELVVASVVDAQTVSSSQRKTLHGVEFDEPSRVEDVGKVFSSIVDKRAGRVCNRHKRTLASGVRLVTVVEHGATAVFHNVALAVANIHRVDRSDVVSDEECVTA